MLCPARARCFPGSGRGWLSQARRSTPALQDEVVRETRDHVQSECSALLQVLLLLLPPLLPARLPPHGRELLHVELRVRPQFLRARF